MPINTKDTVDKAEVPADVEDSPLDDLHEQSAVSSQPNYGSVKWPHSPSKSPKDGSTISSKSGSTEMLDEAFSVAIKPYIDKMFEPHPLFQKFMEKDKELSKASGDKITYPETFHKWKTHMTSTGHIILDSDEPASDSCSEESDGTAQTQSGLENATTLGVHLSKPKYWP